MINPVPPVYRPVFLKRDNHKFTALPPNCPVDKPKKKTWTELLSPWIIVTVFVLVVAFLNGLIGE